MTREECELACGLRVFIKFEDGTDLDDGVIGQVVSHFSGLDNMDCTGLVDHLREINDVYPQVVAGGSAMATWVQDVWNKWFDPKAAPVGCWP